MIMTLSRPEKRLLDTIKDVKFGEIYGVELEFEAGEVQAEVTQNFADLIDAIREGLADISVLTVHQGDPVMAETDYKYNGFSCRKKYRFPTIN